MLPTAVVVRVVMVEVPPICRVPKLVSAPAPVSDVVTFNEPTFKFVYVPVTTIFGMVTAFIVLPAPVNVWFPVPAVKVPLLARLPPKLTASFAELFQVPLALIVTLPVKVFAPVAEVMFRVPETLVVLLTARSNAPALRMPPALIVRVEDAALAVRVIVWPLLMVTVSPATGPSVQPAAQEPVAFQFPVATLVQVFGG